MEGAIGDQAALGNLRRLRFHQHRDGRSRWRNSRGGTSGRGRLYDHLEMELPDLGLIVMQDAETGEQLFVDTHDARFRRQFAEAALRREAALRAALSEAGVDCLELATDDDLVDALMRFTVLRKRRSQLGRVSRRVTADDDRFRQHDLPVAGMLWLLAAVRRSSRSVAYRARQGSLLRANMSLGWR